MSLAVRIEVSRAIQGVVALGLSRGGTVEDAVVMAEQELDKIDKKSETITLFAPNALEKIVQEAWEKKRAEYRAQGIV